MDIAVAAIFGIALLFIAFDFGKRRSIRLTDKGRDAAPGEVA